MEKLIKEYNEIAVKAILEYANADEWDDLATDDWDAVDVQKIIVNVLMEREANKVSASDGKEHDNIAGVSGLFSAEDMENFADYVLVRYTAGYKLKYKELLEDFKSGVK